MSGERVANVGGSSPIPPLIPPPNPPLNPPPISRIAVDALWLVSLRWVAVGGQLITIAVVKLLLGVDLPLRELLAVIAFVAATNLGLQLWLRLRPPSALRRELDHYGHLALALPMAIDLLSLTVLLYLSGGPKNPFVVIYFVNVALAAIVLPDRWAWALTGLAAGCSTALFFQYRPILELEHPVSAGPGGLTIGQQGLLVALTTCAMVVTYFITRVTRELRQREAELRVAEQQRARSERLEALATLAAGAGHELASPLSTIAVIANDLTHHLEGTEVPSSVIEDVSLIRSELDHCRAVLDRMSRDAGQAAGEELGPIRVQDMVREVLEGLRHQQRVRLLGMETLGHARILAPLEGLAQAVRGVVQNALDASDEAQPVEMELARDGDTLSINVRDRGRGMPPEVLARVGEPFFTTKETGKGMGLGLFLTRNVIERLGGTLELQSQVGLGSTAEIRLPLVGSAGAEVATGDRPPRPATL